MKTLKRLFFITLAVRIAVAVLMRPGADEAYYYVYSLHPDLSYFDHPPMVAWIGGMLPGLIGWITPLSIRLGPIVLFTFAIYLFFLLSKSFMSEGESISATAVFMVVPMFFLAGTFLLPDAALIFFWVLGLYAFKTILVVPTVKNWLLLGGVIGLGMLSKYTAGFLYLGGFVFVLIDKRYRRFLFTPGPYLAVFVSLMIFFPVIFWNLKHGFVSFLYQTGRVGFSGIKFRYFYQSLGGQMAYMMPFVFFPAVYFAGKSVVNLLKGENDELNNTVFCFGVLPLFFFISVSLFKKVLPHWPVIGYMTLTLPVGKFYYGLYKKRKKLFNIYSCMHAVIVITLISLALLQIHTGILFNRELPADGIEKKGSIRDISIDIIGWEELNKYLQKEFAPDEVFLFTHKWYLGGQIAFAVKGKYPVLCLSNRKSAAGFSIWQDQEEQLGKKGLFISTSKFFRDPAEKYSAYFDKIELMRSIPIKRSGKLVKKIYIYKCENFKKIYRFKT